MNEIKLVGPEIKGRAGETVRLEAEFGHVTNACVHERRKGTGYKRICDQRTDKLVYDAMVYDDTTDFIVTINDNGTPHLSYEGCNGQVWCPVKVIKDDDPQPEPTPEPQDLGKYLYSVGLLSDLHICLANTPKDEKKKDENKDWGDEKDFIRCMDLFSADKNIKCVMGCGDVSESYTNNDGKHPESTCDADYAEVKQIYDVPYWQIQGMRLFQPLGNHDHYGLFETRKGDERDAKRTDNETIPGYNATASQRLAKLWPTGQQINDIQDNGRCRIVFELEKGAKEAIGQYDMRFFSFNDIVDLYARKGGYKGESVWDPSRNGISEEALRCARDYVNAHWDEVKDRLTMWDDSGGHGRNGYSKLNYWLKKEDDIFIFLSVDYGDDVWEINDKWHDRMIRARKVLDESSEPYVRMMFEYARGAGYQDNEKYWNFQYYNPNALIWLKELIENNPGKKIYLFTHHFMPNRVGNGVGCPVDGNWHYSDIHSYLELDADEGGTYPLGSNALSGVQFYFIRRLLNEHKNLIMFSGHSHISWSSGWNIDNHDYPFIYPDVNEELAYTKASNVASCTSGWSVSLPSMSKPCRIENGQPVKRYDDAEMGVLDIYERGVRIKGYLVKKDSQDVNELLIEKEIKLI